MHSKGIFHRDIKLENIFLPENRRLPFVVLSNFSYSESFSLSPNSMSPLNYKKIGTPGYAAPEIFKTN
jgi:calcium/calmodulin-dependent protein kinase I